ncbi:endonuclease/exonuclease/phosphatase family protein [Kocuria flava]|uniref:endonuclease/exonuclease/phosphatase family protein n=1 Tax=Kocuria flava TaxID=446860 RepID=UPI003F1CEEE8
MRTSRTLPWSPRTPAPPLPSRSAGTCSRPRSTSRTTPPPAKSWPAAPTTRTAPGTRSRCAGAATPAGPPSRRTWNADRTDQAQALVTFTEQLKKTRGTDRIFLTGDVNAYDQEDPMRVLREAGYANLAPAGEYSYAFGGMVGSLDHVLASPAAAVTVTGSDIREINAHESVGLEYSRHNHNVTDPLHGRPLPGLRPQPGDRGAALRHR